MPDESVLDRPTVVTGGGGRSTRRGGGSLGPEGAGSAGTPAGDEFDRLAAMLESIRDILSKLIHLKPPLFPDQLQPRFREVWPETERHLKEAIDGLRSDARPPTWSDLLKNAGLTGSMLQMKETSLNFYLNQVATEVQDYPRVIIPRRKRIVRKLLGWLVPSFEVINSVIGSIPAAVFPGKEIVKEVKEHMAAGCEAVKLTQEGR